MVRNDYQWTAHLQSYSYELSILWQEGGCCWLHSLNLEWNIHFTGSDIQLSLALNIMKPAICNVCTFWQLYNSIVSNSWFVFVQLWMSHIVAEVDIQDHGGMEMNMSKLHCGQPSHDAELQCISSMTFLEILSSTLTPSLARGDHG